MKFPLLIAALLLCRPSFAQVVVDSATVESISSVAFGHNDYFSTPTTVTSTWSTGVSWYGVSASTNFTTTFSAEHISLYGSGFISREYIPSFPTERLPYVSSYLNISFHVLSATDALVSLHSDISDVGNVRTTARLMLFGLASLSLNSNNVNDSLLVSLVPNTSYQAILEFRSDSLDREITDIAGAYTNSVASITLVPEPAPIALVVFGTFALLSYCRRAEQGAAANP